MLTFTAATALKGLIAMDTCGLVRNLFFSQMFSKIGKNSKPLTTIYAIVSGGGMASVRPRCPLGRCLEWRLVGTQRTLPHLGKPRSLHELLAWPQKRGPIARSPFVWRTLSLRQSIHNFWPMWYDPNQGQLGLWQSPWNLTLLLSMDSDQTRVVFRTRFQI